MLPPRFLKPASASTRRFRGDKPFPVNYLRHGPHLAVGLTMLLAGCSVEPETVSAPRLSIILINVDTLRADRLSAYGNSRRTSPAIDAWAGRSTRFEWAFAQAPNTPPSQASILSGLYPTTHGRIEDRDILRQEAATLAEVLKDAGYRTAAFTDGGFMRRGFGLEQGFDVWDDENHGVLHSGPKAEAWLRNQGVEPFFLLLHTYDVHSPYAPLEPFRSRFLDGLAPPTPGFEPTSERLEEIRLSKYSGQPQRLPDADLAYSLALYDGEIAQFDSWFGSFLELLSETGIDRRAVVALVSDHGEEFQEHGSLLHDSLYLTVTRVPMIVRLPDQTQGRTVGSIVETIDLMPTLLAAVALPVPESTQGQNLWPLVNGKARGRTWAYAETPKFSDERLFVTAGWSFHLREKSGRRELYRFRDDPRELRDLAATAPETVSRVSGALKALRGRIQPLGSEPAQTIEFDEETIRDLRALGYLR